MIEKFDMPFADQLYGKAFLITKACSVGEINSIENYEKSNNVKQKSTAKNSALHSIENGELTIDN